MGVFNPSFGCWFCVKKNRFLRAENFGTKGELQQNFGRQKNSNPSRLLLLSSWPNINKRERRVSLLFWLAERFGTLDRTIVVLTLLNRTPLVV